MWNAQVWGALTAVVSLAFLGSSARAADADFKPLFNGKDFAGLKYVLGKTDKGDDPAKTKTWKVEKDTIICSGSPNGYFYTDKSYKNYVLKFDVRYARPADLTDDTKFNGNSGFLIHIQGEHTTWPKCVEVQGMNKSMGNTFSIGGAPKGDFKLLADVQKKAIKPVGEWNTVEITSENGKLTTKINGMVVAEGTSELKEGPIGWQSEGAEIHFKNLMIKELK